jgi:pimeloyl-ACP methyl ester carboxylesterase
MTDRHRHRTAKAPRGAGFLAPALLLIALLLATPTLARIQTVATRAGVAVDFQVEVPEGASALILLFEGANGVLEPGSQGFAHKAYPLFLRHGIAAALIDAPSDRSGFRGGLDPRFRESSAHFADIDAVIKALRRDYALPVWILGWSTGTRSAAAYALHSSKRIAGVVLASSSTNPPNGDPIHTLPRIETVTVPVLAVAHLGDTCLGTPPSGAAEIARAATASAAAMAMLFSGGLDTGPIPCGNETHHAFFGIEEDVAAAIAAFIAAHTADEARLSTLRPE